jgi:hypothetical protein
MTYKRLVITIVLAAFIFTLIPAALAAGGTISGKIAFPANTTLETDFNKTVDVTMMTIYAVNTNTGFLNTTQPHADGTYSIPVPENGMYRIWVSPNKIYDATNYEHMLPVEYPDMGSRLYLITVSGNTNNVDISYYPSGQFVSPNNMTLGSPTPSATVTPKPSSGFAIVLALVGLVAAFAIVGRRKL